LHGLNPDKLTAYETGELVRPEYTSLRTCLNYTSSNRSAYLV